MDAKKAVTTVLSAGGMIGLGIIGIICKNSSSQIDKTVEVVKEPKLKNIPISELMEEAKKIHYRNEVFIDTEGKLTLLYKSGRGHQTNVQKFGVDKTTKKLVPLNGGTLYTPGQRGSYAESFLKRINERFIFE